AFAAVGFSLLNARSTGASESEHSGIGVAPELFAERNTEPADGMWRDIDKSDLMAGTNADELPIRFRALKLDSGQMKQFLAQLPNEDLASRSVRNPLVALPMPGGGFARFEIEESPSVEAPLLKEFPFLKTYRGQGVDDRSATVRMDFTPAGFHAIVLSANGAVYIDPLKNRPDDLYVSYFKKDRGSPGDFACGVDPVSANLTRGNTDADLSSGATLRTYVIAIGANGEWTQAHGGGTVAGALAEITTILNRTNAIWEREFSIRFLLTASNAAVVFTNPATDPFVNDRNGIFPQSHPALANGIGTANFDVGHVFYEGDNGGAAQTPATCSTTLKGFGVSGQVTSSNLDTFDHELGHQFNANHTFNRSFIDNGNDQRFPPTAFEPALGSTFMGYGFNNESYHGASIAEITSYAALAGNVCADRTITGNSIPTVTVGGPYNVPKQTPFKLTAAAFDADGDTLTYDWQENDLGPAFVVPPTGYVQDNDADGNARPIFRNYPPRASPSRTFPSIEYILDYANLPP
ncbi:MAG TPA: zinc-dependent metalloprotease family protein, partial [Pyrinomonadaceae bacterium]|nr:zinc-dependent metalloprotease family protein [Pyrinomonadaceae bacterium]